MYILYVHGNRVQKLLQFFDVRPHDARGLYRLAPMQSTT